MPTGWMTLRSAFTVHSGQTVRVVGERLADVDVAAGGAGIGVDGHGGDLGLLMCTLILRPASESPARAHLSDALLGLRAHVRRGHDEQLVAVPEGRVLLRTSPRRCAR